MEIKRDELLAELHTVEAGLSPKETIEQSDHFVFQNGEVMTYNDEVACRTKSKLSITGAVHAKKMLDMLKHWPEEIIEFNRTKGRLNFKGKSKRGYFVTQDQVTLPIKNVETPTKWKKVSSELVSAIRRVQECACNAGESPHLSCVHITKNWVEAADGFQMGRCTLKTPFSKPVLLRRDAMKQVLAFENLSVEQTKNWVHFKSGELTISCSKYMDEYPSDRITAILSTKGSRTILPEGLRELVDRLRVFVDDDAKNNWLKVEITSTHMKITGSGAYGSQTERKKVKYKGKPLAFNINPQLLRDLTDRDNKCEVSEKLIKVTKDNFEYVTALWIPEEPKE